MVATQLLRFAVEVWAHNYISKDEVFFFSRRRVRGSMCGNEKKNNNNKGLWG